MTTLSILTNYLENKLINHLLRNTPYIHPVSVWLALHTISPSDSKIGVEVSSGTGYVRQQVYFSVDYGIAYNSQAISFPQATGNWGTITSVSIMDASTYGNMLFWGKITNDTMINTGENFYINQGLLQINLFGNTRGGWGYDAATKLLRKILTNQDYVSTGDYPYVALGNNLIVDERYAFQSWVEVPTGVGNGYSRMRITDWYSPTSGSTTNLSLVNFYTPPVPANWGLITHVGIFYSAIGGDLWMWGKLHSPVYITNGDGLKFEAGNIDISLN